MRWHFEQCAELGGEQLMKKLGFGLLVLALVVSATPAAWAERGRGGGAGGFFWSLAARPVGPGVGAEGTESLARASQTGG